MEWSAGEVEEPCAACGRGGDGLRPSSRRGCPRPGCPGRSPPPACAAHCLPALWRCQCGTSGCRGCRAHQAHPHQLRPPREAQALLAREARQLHAELRRLALRRRDVLLRARAAAAALAARLDAELAEPAPSALPAERGRLRARVAAAAAQARLDDAASAAATPLAWGPLWRALRGAGRPPPLDRRDPLLFLANFCAAQLLARPAAASPAASPPPRPLSPLPLLFFHLEVDGAPCGRVVIEVRSDVAPRMARNFAVLAAGELGVGYRGCAVFQCWENESVITGDFELNDGRGGRSVFEESYFMPDDTKLAAVRGAVGMRRSQKRHDNLGLVGSQFRILLREMRGFTAIFASVVEGLELVDRLSRTGDSAGKPHSTILISSCGQLN